jgi:hypothetical protein
MSAPDNVSYISRFLAKFVEIIAAGLATAASGYLIAHLSGLSSDLILHANTTASDPPNGSMIWAPPGQPPAPIAADANAQRLVPEQELSAPRAAQPARRNVSVTKPVAGKHTDNATAAGESTRGQSLAAQVRAALANADANHTDPQDSWESGSATRQAPAIAQPQPGHNQSILSPVSAAPPGAPELRPAPRTGPSNDPQPTAVEIISHPIATVQPSPSASLEKNNGVLSTLDQMLRQDPLAGASDAPRPPMPVGE